MIEYLSNFFSTFLTEILLVLGFTEAAVEALVRGGLVLLVFLLGKPYLTETYREAALALIAEVTTRPDWLDGRMS